MPDLTDIERIAGRELGAWREYAEASRIAHETAGPPFHVAPYYITAADAALDETHAVIRELGAMLREAWSRPWPLVNTNGGPIEYVKWLADLRARVEGGGG
ncbi:MAG: hypothetical protein ABFE13_11945 [Phycisphaerales bacterium]